MPAAANISTLRSISPSAPRGPAISPPAASSDVAGGVDGGDDGDRLARSRRRGGIADAPGAAGLATERPWRRPRPGRRRRCRAPGPPARPPRRRRSPRRDPGGPAVRPARDRRSGRRGRPPGRAGPDRPASRSRARAPRTSGPPRRRRRARARCRRSKRIAVASWGLASGSITSVSRVPGPPPRTSTPARDPGGGRITVQPVGASGAVQWPTSKPAGSGVAAGLIAGPGPYRPRACGAGGGAIGPGSPGRSRWSVRRRRSG